MTEQEGRYVLAMPFVSVVSAGGPHDDVSYACGWEMGSLDAVVGHAAEMMATIPPQTIRAVNRTQADLIAMRHGFVLTARPIESYPEHVSVEFTRPLDNTPPDE